MSAADTKNPSPQPLSPQAGRGAKNVKLAQGLRKKPTDAELKLWRALRDRRLAGIKFLRQFPIDRYVVDFICRPAKLVIELDGGQHEINVAKDQQRTDLLNALGYRVIRFWNNEVLSNLDGVLTIILHELGLDPANPEAPSPRGSGERAGGEGQSKKETKPC